MKISFADKKVVCCYVIYTVSSILMYIGLMACNAETKIEKHSKGDSNTGPKIDFENKSYNLGAFICDTTKTLNINYKNIGDQLLEIKEIKKSCQCLGAKATMRLNPGESGLINFQFKCDFPFGSFVHLLTVVSNDPIEPVVNLRIDGTRLSPYIANPGLIDLGFIGKNIDYRYSITVSSDRKGKIMRAEFEKKLMAFMEIGDFVDGKQEIQIHGTTNDDIYSSINDNILLWSNEYEYPVLRIPVRGTIFEGYYCKPDYVNWGVISKDKPQYKKVYIGCSKNQSIDKLDIRYRSESGLTVSRDYDHVMRRFIISIRWIPIRSDQKLSEILDVDMYCHDGTKKSLKIACYGECE